MQVPFASHDCPLRVAPHAQDVRNLAALQSLPEVLAERKLESIRNSWSIMEEREPFPTRRAWQDLSCLLLFGVATCGILLTSCLCPSKPPTANSHQGSEVLQPYLLFAVASAGAVGSLAAAFVCTLLARKAPKCVAWAALFSRPALTTLLAFVFVFGAASQGRAAPGVAGVLLAAFGIWQLVVTCREQTRSVSFTAKLTEVTSDVIKCRPCFYSAVAVGVFLGFLWTTICMLALARAFVEVHEVTKCILVSSVILLFAWGSLVVTNLCHMVHCGIFGLWYHGKDCPRTMLSSLRVAATTSLGSVCFGSLLVWFLQGLAVVAQCVQRIGHKQSKGLAFISSTVLGRFIVCMDDASDCFNDWALIQCAVRGTSFLESAAATYSVIACANVQYIMEDLLLSSLALLSGIVCSLAGGFVAASTGWALGGASAALVGGSIGVMIGMIAGAAALGGVSSGIMTVLVCWAEDPLPLIESHPDVHLELESKILGRLRGNPALQQHP
mmetsp:Transcript_83515/g.165762  ORF Transcript_83515/g.165762 Transcript_83515/m.165762 type:complete len:498 (+) Transcript_83515:58-1551(+)